MGHYLLHEGNMIVEDRLTHNFMPKTDPTPPTAVSYAAVQKWEQKLEMILF